MRNISRYRGCRCARSRWSLSVMSWPQSSAGLPPGRPKAGPAPRGGSDPRSGGAWGLSFLFVAFQRGQIALGQTELARLEQAAHALAPARLGQVVAEVAHLARRRRAQALARMAQRLAPQRFARLVTRLERPEGLHPLARHRVGNADDAGLGHGRMLHQGALHLEGPDQVAGRLDHVVGTADEPVVAIGVPAHQIAWEVPAVHEALALALF